MNEPNLPRFIPDNLTPTDEQRAIMLAQNKVVLIDANAGAAKTTTLALRIGEALARKLAPEQILALTFTPEARDVLRQRLQDIGVPQATVARLAVLTFEDFSTRLLAPFDLDNLRQLLHARLLKPYVLEAIEQVATQYAGSIDGLDLRTHHIALSQFLDVQLTLKATMALDADVEFMGHDEIAQQLNVPLTDYLVTVEYERIRGGGGEGAQFRGPFDATYDLARGLAALPDLAAQLPDYRVVLCDELHDLNEASFRILQALMASPQCYFIGAGDRDQVIHAQLGASDAFLARRFAEQWPALVRYPLTHTWRHGPHLAYAMAEFKRKPIESRLPLRTGLRQLHYDAAFDADPAAGAQQVVAAIAQWRADGLPLDGCAILIRDRHQSVAIENALMQASIGYRTQHMAGYLQRDEILFLRGMLAIALNDLAAVRSDEVRRAIVDALAIFGEVTLAPATLERAKKDIARDPSLLAHFFSAYIERDLERDRSDDAGRHGGGGDDRHGNHHDHGDGGRRMHAARQARQAVVDTVAWLATIDHGAPAATILREICDRMNLLTAARRIFVRPYDAAVVAKSVAGLLAAAEASRLDLRQFWAWLNAGEAFSSRKRDRGAVLIECVANSKGKEFSHVILPYLESGEFPHPLADKLAEENLFYVGATRARARLTLLSPADPALRSSFIGQMKLAKSAPAADAAVERNEAGPAPGAAPAAPARHYLTATFHEKEQVKALGAEYDLARRAWFVAPGKDLAPFAPWLRKQ